MHLVYIKVQSLMPKVQSQSQKSEALFKLVWTTVQLCRRACQRHLLEECQTVQKIRFERFEYYVT